MVHIYIKYIYVYIHKLLACKLCKKTSNMSHSKINSRGSKEICPDDCFRVKLKSSPSVA